MVRARSIPFALVPFAMVAACGGADSSGGPGVASDDASSPIK